MNTTTLTTPAKIENEVAKLKTNDEIIAFCAAKREYLQDEAYFMKLACLAELDRIEQSTRG